MIIRLLVFIFSLAFILTAYSQQSASLVSLSKSGLITSCAEDVFFNPDQLLLWKRSPLPVVSYSSSQLAVQKTINQTTSEILITYSPENEKSQWNEIDKEEINPYTWRWIDLVLINDSTTKLSLRRPIWWLDRLGAKDIGDVVNINLPEIGVVGLAKVNNIRINQLDTRIWNEQRNGDFIQKPITGKIIHTSNEVYQLFFTGNDSPLKITADHPIWSEDRSQWVGASKLKINERVKVRHGIVCLEKRNKLTGTHVVYNLEVFRDHNFFASSSQILVHNICWSELADQLHLYMIESGLYEKNISQIIRLNIPLKSTFVSKVEGDVLYALVETTLDADNMAPVEAAHIAKQKGLKKVVVSKSVQDYTEDDLDFFRKLYKREGFKSEIIEINNQRYLQLSKDIPIDPKNLPN